MTATFRDVRYALACRDGTNQSGLEFITRLLFLLVPCWHSHDKLKHIGHQDTLMKQNSGPRMSDEAVAAKTGKNWKQWFAIINKAGGQKMTHQEIVKLLNSKHNVGPWWGQMVTATYEQQTGLRQNHEKPDGFEISVSRTLNVPVSSVYSAFADESARNSWLAEDGLV